jgi:CRP/FNR family cyclic AMP-dependent transcriptional regulator
MTSLAVNAALLKTMPLFARLSDRELATLIPTVQHRFYPRHSFMVRANEKTNGLYVIVSGKAKVSIEDGQGREATLSLIGPSEFFGELSFIDEKPRSASVQALEPCEVLCIPKPALMACLAQNFDVMMLMLRYVVARVREANLKIASLALMDVHGRVASLLMEVAKDVNGAWVVDTGSEEIARMVGASREMVSRVLKEMREGGLIRRDKRKIVVLDRESMAGRRTLH